MLGKKINKREVVRNPGSTLGPNKTSFHNVFAHHFFASLFTIPDQPWAQTKLLFTMFLPTIFLPSSATSRLDWWVGGLGQGQKRPAKAGTPTKTNPKSYR
jgi:hypothetical protein